MRHFDHLVFHSLSVIRWFPSWWRSTTPASGGENRRPLWILMNLTPLVRQVFLTPLDQQQDANSRPTTRMQKYPRSPQPISMAVSASPRRPPPPCTDSLHVPVMLFSSRGVMCFVIFTVAAGTDYLDGYFARRWQISTRLGAFREPSPPAASATTTATTTTASTIILCCCVSMCLRSSVSLSLQRQ